METNRNYNDDCLDTMFMMPDGFIDMVLTSPPYDNLRKYNGYSFQFEEVVKELYRIIKSGGVVVWVVGDSTKNGSESGTSFRQALCFKDVGFRLHDTMIYRKINYIPLTHNRYEQEFEYMFVFSKGKPKTFNPIKVECKIKGTVRNKRTFYQSNNTDTPTVVNCKKPVSDEKIKGNVWDLTTNCGAKGHPAQFPEKLAEDHILSWSNKNDLIYDPFMGSGTTAKMSQINDRRWIGSEVSEKYCGIIEERLRRTKDRQ